MNDNLQNSTIRRQINQCKKGKNKRVNWLSLQVSVISSIGPEESPTRKGADIVYEEIIKLITLKMDYETTRAEQINEQGIITSQIIHSILSSNLIIADLSN